MPEIEKLSQELREAITKEIVEEIFKNKEKLNMAWHWGEPSLLVCDIVNIVNNVMQTDYKRYGANASRMNWNNNIPHTPLNNKCVLCKKHWYHHEDFDGCMGISEDVSESCKEFERID